MDSGAARKLPLGWLVVGEAAGALELARATYCCACGRRDADTDQSRGR